MPTNSLIKSLDEKPNKDWLKRINECEDEKVLKYFLKDSQNINIKDNEENLKILWECCQIPDFVKKTYGNHFEVIGNVFKFLTSKKGLISEDYMRLQLMKLDKLDGNVDSLSNRIANVRTWAYVSNKSNWVENQDYWIERTKNLEDKLSDRLHEELTKSFIDKRASVLSKGLKQDITFDNKKLALNYLDHLKTGGYYPYKPKTIYQNGVYFGQSSKRWVLGYYHKGKEIDQKRTKKDIVSSELKALADITIRAEIKLYYRQLKKWDLRFAYQWSDIDDLDKFFKVRLKKLRLPDFSHVINLSKITNNADKKFYNCLLNGDVDILYDRSTIYRKRLKFLLAYNIDIDSINNKKLKGNICKS